MVLRQYSGLTVENGAARRNGRDPGEGGHDTKGLRRKTKNRLALVIRAAVVLGGRTDKERENPNLNPEKAADSATIVPNGRRSNCRANSEFSSVRLDAGSVLNNVGIEMDGLLA